jgi:hypothetical protein
MLAMPRTNLTGANMPRDFPVETYDRVNERVAAIRGDGPSPIWGQFAEAWSAVGYRFVAAARADARFASAYRRHDRLGQELHLFGFVSAACSALECTSYAVFSVGAIVDPQRFPLVTESERKRVDLVETARRVGTTYPDDPLASLLDRVRVDSEWRQLVDWRDIQIHRGNPSRILQRHVGDGASSPDMWRIGTHRGADVP